MRLIDADSVLKWFAEYWAMQKKLGRPSKQQRAIYMTMRSMVNSVKTVDAVPVVRCKDCKHWHCDDSESYCDELGIFDTDMNSYCSYAKRREE